METLDFTWTNAEAPTGQNNGFRSEEQQTAGKLQRIADKAGADNTRAAEVLKQYQDNVRRTTVLRADIMRGLQTGEDIHALFLKAVEALGLCVSDSSLYDRAQATLTAVYGEGLRATTPLQIERDAVRNRLDKLTAAAERCTEETRKGELQRAIAAHKRRLEELQ